SPVGAGAGAGAGGPPNMSSVFSSRAGASASSAESASGWLIGSLLAASRAGRYARGRRREAKRGHHEGAPGDEPATPRQPKGCGRPGRSVGGRVETGRDPEVNSLWLLPSGPDQVGEASAHADLRALYRSAEPRTQAPRRVQATGSGVRALSAGAGAPARASAMARCSEATVIGLDRCPSAPAWRPASTCSAMALAVSMITGVRG